MNHMVDFTLGWMHGGTWGWMLLSAVLVVLLVLAVAKLSKEES